MSTATCRCGEKATIVEGGQGVCSRCAAARLTGKVVRTTRPDKTHR